MSLKSGPQTPSNRAIMRRLAAALILASALSLSACGSAAKKDCLILSNGNKVCGQDAAAWCLETDASRLAQIVDNAAAVKGTVDACNDLEIKYGLGFKVTR